MIRFAMISFFISTTVAFAATIDPVGQKAFYRLDKSSKRTSSMIKSGAMNAEVVTHVAATSTEPAGYEMLLNYNFKVTFVGDKKGSEKVMLDEAYFTEEFLVELRKTGFHEGANFKVKHLGFADATTLDGITYVNCDKLYFYDIEQTSFLSALASSFMGVSRAQIEDVTATALVYPGIPVLGGVKIDMTGVSSGVKVKVGGDYIP